MLLTGITSNLPCIYEDTPLFEGQKFIPTAGSACADSIVAGMEFDSIFSIEIPDGSDTSHLSRDTIHSGQIGSLRLPTSIFGAANSSYAIDTRLLQRKRAVTRP
ncbi:MAG: hypothetical protein AAFS02_07555 [Pseudomonadota bacterium]